MIEHCQLDILSVILFDVTQALWNHLGIDEACFGTVRLSGSCLAMFSQICTFLSRVLPTCLGFCCWDSPLSARSFVSSAAFVFGIVSPCDLPPPIFKLYFRDGVHHSLTPPLPERRLSLRNMRPLVSWHEFTPDAVRSTIAGFRECLFRLPWRLVCWALQNSWFANQNCLIRSWVNRFSIALSRSLSFVHASVLALFLLTGYIIYGSVDSLIRALLSCHQSGFCCINCNSYCKFVCWAVVIQNAKNISTPCRAFNFTEHARNKQPIQKLHHIL